MRGKSQQADTEFEKYLARRSTSLHDLTPQAAFEIMRGFYCDVRFDDCSPDANGDMLLFQWGTYDWGEGPSFEFDFTRQLIQRQADDDDIWQLHLTLRFEPSDELHALGSGNQWCVSPTKLAGFESFVRGSRAYVAMASRTDGRVELDYEHAG